MFSTEEYTGSDRSEMPARMVNPSMLSGAFTFFGLALAVSAVGVWLGFEYFAVVFQTQGAMFAAIAVQLVLAFTSHIWSAKLPFGYFMFALFALITGLTLVPILALAGSVGGSALILKGLLATTATFLACALYAKTTQRNLLGMGGFLMMSLVGLIIISILGIFWPWNSTMEIIVSSFSIILFAGFTMYDVQRVMATPGLNPLLAGISLYLNFINLFISFLRLLIAMRGDRG